VYWGCLGVRGFGVVLGGFDCVIVVVGCFDDFDY